MFTSEKLVIDEEDSELSFEDSYSRAGEALENEKLIEESTQSQSFGYAGDI